MLYERQKNKLFQVLGDTLVQALRKSNAIIAGGTITSIFSNAEINDFDIYFRSKEDMKVLIRNFYADEDLPEDVFVDICPYTYVFVGMTQRSINFAFHEQSIQLIHFDYYESPKEIFEDYDFTINMGAYDFKTDEFVFHDEFLSTVAERRLSFNKSTAYPIISLLRVQKYIDRSYTISKKEMFKIALAINSKQIDTWEKLKDQLSGFYGVEVGKFFDCTKEFDLDSAIDMLDQINDNHYEIPSSMSLDLTSLLHLIDNPNQKIFYKKIRETNGTLRSFYHEEFVWEVGEMHNGGQFGLFCCLTLDQALQYGYNRGDDTKIAVLSVQDMSQIEYNSSEIVLSGDVKLLQVFDYADVMEARKQQKMQKNQK